MMHGFLKLPAPIDNLCISLFMVRYKQCFQVAVVFLYVTSLELNTTFPFSFDRT